MPHEQLHLYNVGAGLQQITGKTVPQALWGQPVYPILLGCQLLTALVCRVLEIKPNFLSKESCPKEPGILC
jgi:hypothetical protein